jgi:hypothetical protein
VLILGRVRSSQHQVANFEGSSANLPLVVSMKGLTAWSGSKALTLGAPWSKSEGSRQLTVRKNGVNPVDQLEVVLKL